MIDVSCKGKYKTTGGYHWKYGDNLLAEMVGEKNETSN